MGFKTVFFMVIMLFGIGVFTPAEGRSRRGRGPEARFQQAISQAKRGEHSAAARKLFSLMRSSGLSESRKREVRYQLAMNLYRMKLYHPALFQFQHLVRSNARKYVGRSLQTIAIIATELKSDAFLHHAISKGSLKYMSASERDRLHYHFGEYWMRKRKINQAITHFARVKSSSPFFYKALYQLGLANSELGRTRRAIGIFDNLEKRRTRAIDKIRVAAIMGKARAYYQSKNWDRAVQEYRRVPKDSLFWHDILLEKSWALLRGGKFRSALSNFQTLHSDYYEDFYQPESLILRAIVYLYICKYTEMEKVLDLFQKIYSPLFAKVNRLLKRKRSTLSYYQGVIRSVSRKNGEFPTPVASRILREGDFATIHYYIGKIDEEFRLLESLPNSFVNSSLGRWSRKIVRKRRQNARKNAGLLALAHLRVVAGEMKEFFTQEQFLRYEMLRSRRGFLKQKIARRASKGISIEDFDRDYYIQNGYEYWPFKGEYWLDELGNYYYLGVGSCR